MRAVVCTRYGPPDVLRLRELPEPVPGRDEVRIKMMHATAVTSSDCLIRSLDLPFGMRIAARLAVA